MSKSYVPGFLPEQKIIPDEEWEPFLEALRRTLPATFRITGFRGQAQEVLKFVKGNYINNLVDKTAEGEDVDKPYPLPWYPDEAAWQLNHDRQILRKVPALEKLHKFLVSETDSGNISRQELVSMIPPLLLDVKSNHLVLDMCAAPGSKTAQIIEALHRDETTHMPEGVVIGNDNDNKRCYIMVHQAKRLNSPCCMVVNHDARFFPKLFVNRPDGTKEQIMYDRVLCDVPCSGDGTLRKNVIIWKQWAQTSAISLHNLQRQILKRGSELLAVGGKLVYSTCSFNPIENEAVVASVLRESEGSLQLLDVSNQLPGLKRRPGLQTWKVINETPEEYARTEDVPEKKRRRYLQSMWPPSEEEAEGLNLHRCMRIVPHDQNSGGFFVAVIEKSKRLPHEKEPVLKAITPAAKMESETVGEESIKDDTETTREGQESATSVEEAGYTKDDSITETAATSVTKNAATSVTEDDAAKEQTATSNEGDTEGNTSKQDTEEPPHKKPRVERGHYNTFKEDPFVYFEGDEAIWPDIKEFYKLDDAFPIKQLLTRSIGGKKRNLYFTNEKVKSIIQSNQDKLKVINSGVKMMSRSDAEGVNCSFRLSQEGIDCLFPFMANRRVLVDKSDIIKLLSTECPFDCTFSEKMQNQIHKIGQGSLVFVCDSEIENVNQATLKSLIIVGWKGKTSVRSYLDKNSRDHYLRMCGVDVIKKDSNESKKHLESVKTVKVDVKEDLEEEAVEDGEDVMEKEMSNTEDLNVQPKDEEVSSAEDVSSMSHDLKGNASSSAENSKNDKT